MKVDASNLTTILALVFLGNGLTEGIVKPLADRFKWEKIWLMYASWGVCALLVIASQNTIFPGIFPGPVGHWVGIVATGLAAGRGANFLHDLVKIMQGAVESLKMIGGPISLE